MTIFIPANKPSLDFRSITLIVSSLKSRKGMG